MDSKYKLLIKAENRISLLLTLFTVLAIIMIGFLGFVLGSMFPDFAHNLSKVRLTV